MLKEPQVWLALLMTVFGFGGVFVVFTYIAPILEQVSGFAPHAVTLVLVLFGIGLAIGNTAGGKLADRAPMQTLIGVFAALIVIMCIFSSTMHHQVAALVTIFMWAIAAFATIPSLQTRVLTKASTAPNLAATLNIGAFNVGNALGAWLGGAALAHRYALDTLPLIAVGMTIVAVAITVLAMRIDRRKGAALKPSTTKVTS